MLRSITLASLMLIASQATAAIVIPFDYTGRINTVSFNDFEQIFRPDTTGPGDITLGGLNYHILNPQTEAPALGDIFVQLYSANGLQVDGGNVPNAFGAQEFTGYGIQRVVGFGPGVDPDTDIIFGATLVDPFGVLTPADIAAGVALKLYADSTQNFTHQSGGAVAGTPLPTAADLIADVASATGGTSEFFGSFHFGAATDVALGGATGVPGYFESDVTGTPATSTRSVDFGNAYTGLNIFVNGVGGVYGGITGVDSKQYSLTGQSSFGVNIGALAGTGVAADYQSLKDNGTSNWSVASDDPFEFTINAVPEPVSILVWLCISSFGLLATGRGARN